MHGNGKKQEVAPEHGILGPQPEHVRGRKTLVLDLDETLVHSSFKPPEKPDVIIPVDIEGKVCYVYVLVRPGTIKFLEELSNYYEVIIYTASLSKYADPLMSILDQGGWCTARLFREHCTFYNGIFVKDMSLLGRPLKDVIIIDNSPNSYMFQPENAVPSISWYDDMNDRGLYDKIPLLIELSKVPDVRPFILDFVKDNEINYARAYYILKQYMQEEHGKLEDGDTGNVEDS